ncbi:MAG: endolytic transglycosylase MltG [Candidatus Pacebacteria bacterium]|nr:endolytic transglycosylase MltG [Candidatus Paceibacterota bacterium]
MNSKSQIKKEGVLLLIVGVLYVMVGTVNWLLLPPKTFEAPYSFTIDSGQSLFSISKELSDEGVIRSRRIFEMIMLTLGNDKTISLGQYYFEKPVGVIAVAMRISGRDFGIDRQKVTFPEGFTNKQMSERLKNQLQNFDSELFLELTKDKEGYLFPDTYHFIPWSNPETVINTLTKTFDQKISSLDTEISSSKRTLEENIIMASIIEKEAKGEEDRYFISGILWKRIDRGIPLQVDAPFLYILGKESKDLTRTDLAINSPFNTYKYKGLTPSPIGNPGLDSIKAALSPKESPYLYYLHDKNGKIYYAKTYEEHKQNISKYLK